MADGNRYQYNGTQTDEQTNGQIETALINFEGFLCTLVEEKKAGNRILQDIDLNSFLEIRGSYANALIRRQARSQRKGMLEFIQRQMPDIATRFFRNLELSADPSQRTSVVENWAAFIEVTSKVFFDPSFDPSLDNSKEIQDIISAAPKELVLTQDQRISPTARVAGRTLQKPMVNEKKSWHQRAKTAFFWAAGLGLASAVSFLIHHVIQHDLAMIASVSWGTLAAVYSIKGAAVKGAAILSGKFRSKIDRTSQREIHTFTNHKKPLWRKTLTAVADFSDIVCRPIEGLYNYTPFRSDGPSVYQYDGNGRLGTRFARSGLPITMGLEEGEPTLKVQKGPKSWTRVTGYARPPKPIRYSQFSAVN